MIRVCFHGAESTGKSTLAEMLAAEFGCPHVPEYGRAYAENYGTDFTLSDLLAIASGQDAAMRIACHGAPRLVLLDTDPLMTAAWAEMLFGEAPEELFAYPKAEHYLLFAADTPWRDDGTRMFGSTAQRARFAEVAEAMLHRAGAAFTLVSGTWHQREETARAAIDALLAKQGDRV